MTMRPIRFGIQTPQEGATFDALAHWREADALGDDAVFLDDHFYGVVRPPGEPQLEGFTTLAAQSLLTLLIATFNPGGLARARAEESKAAPTQYDV